MKIKLDNLGIKYMIGDFKNIGFKDYVMQKIKKQHIAKEFWAVDGMSFELQKGDFLGIAGKNGAGKSTLLKTIAGIMQPSRGNIETEGKIAALLELGTGFDGEMTVRENTFLRGALMGYTREFMHETYPDIIAFAELENFQDRPFRQLSSGMKSRLAFSIACLVKPDILILDEVLSVGDGSFKQKSEERMKSIIGGGAITLFVSHSLPQIRKLCNKVLWLDKGKQIAFGESNEVIDQYEQFLKTKKLPESFSIW
ncbi:MAG: ABC transporter ATP-binding protein [Defluviitaleaceae bacterium]|nr:ABC transporter ATP-binding protein [Defluviitaleaceae bacterium]